MDTKVFLIFNLPIFWKKKYTLQLTGKNTLFAFTDYLLVISMIVPSVYLLNFQLTNRNFIQKGKSSLMTGLYTKIFLMKNTIFRQKPHAIRHRNWNGAPSGRVIEKSQQKP